MYLYQGGEVMSKSIPVKLPLHHQRKKAGGLPCSTDNKAWETAKEHHVSELEQHSKSRQPKHFPTRRWHIQLENHKGPKI